MIVFILFELIIAPVCNASRVPSWCAISNLL